MNKLYFSPSGDGHINLASDEYVLEKYRSGEFEGVTLLFYVNTDAVIIGRNQNAWRECNIARMERDGVQLVRRHTGGGAVYHDGGNLNFSFITGEKLYDKDRFTRVVLAACRAIGIEAEVTGRNDITFGGRKFSGCAYGLSGTARAMHGTMLISSDLDRLSGYLSPSKLKLAAKGISSVRSRVMNLSEAAQVSADRMRELISAEFIKEFGPAEELILDPENDAELARLIEKQRSWEWRFGSTPVFDAAFEGRLSFGELRLEMRLKAGRVERATVFTDSLDADIPAEIEALVKGCRFDGGCIAEALLRGGAAAKELAEFIENTEGDPVMFTESQTDLIENSLAALHCMPELAFNEERTKAFIADFIGKNTTLEFHDMGAWLYAAHREGAGETIVVRGDFDAVPCDNGARHLCGHDGHTASLLGLALLMEGSIIGKNVILLFQPAEETGAGAPLCCDLFEKEGLTAQNCRVIGAHNIPGRSMGSVLLRRGTFACASCGMEIALHGRPTHAAYPENGSDPTPAAARLALKLPVFASEVSKKHGCMTLATIVGMRTGERAFGVAASEGRLWVTLRSERTEALEELIALAGNEAGELAAEYGLEMDKEFFDVFPATVNDGAMVEAAENALKQASLPYEYVREPFRWSEDFGHYGGFAPSVFIGIGSGEETAPLHTAEYAYPAGLELKTAKVFLELLKGM